MTLFVYGLARLIDNGFFIGMIHMKADNILQGREQSDFKNVKYFRIYEPSKLA